MKLNLSNIVKFEFKGKHLLGRIINIEPTKFGKLITVACQGYKIGIAEKNIIEIIEKTKKELDL